MKKKKLTNGEKREIRLRFLRRQLMRAGKILKGTPLKECRGLLEEHIKLKDAKPRKKRKKTTTTKKQRRKVRKTLKAKFRKAMNDAKKARRVKRKSAEEVKTRLDPFKRLPRKIKKQNLKLSQAELKLMQELEKERDHGQAKSRVPSLE